MVTKNYKIINNALGWAIGILASAVYILTAEPSASWWDCGEYIATTYKMLIGHPPGAPTFQIIGRFFALFAGGDVTKVAYCINVMSALCSGLTIMFLFWTITMLGRKLVEKLGGMTPGREIALFGSALVGALTYTFSDTFWFSAVEGEVYAMSSFFTALVFWCILKWDVEYDHPREGVNPARWLILIAYLVGLSIGVHLLNLLTLPAIVLVIYYKMSKNVSPMGVVLSLAIISFVAAFFFSTGMMFLIWLLITAPLTYLCIKKGTLKSKADWGVFLSIIGSFVLLAAILFGIIPGIVSLAGKFEVFFVNYIRLPFNGGTIVYFLLLFALIGWGINYSLKKKKTILFASIFGFIFLLVSYSTFLTLVIRSNVDPTIDENSPENAVALLSYLNREQYGSTPVFSGPSYNSQQIQGKDGNPIYEQDRETGKYVVSDNRKGSIPQYKDNTLFPRMYKPDKAEDYKAWLKKYYDPTSPEGKEAIRHIDRNKIPTREMNIKFLQTYQLNYMYFRYFMWNFSGRQNDIQGFGDEYNGNWVTGIPFVDDMLVGRQDNLPPSMERPGHNNYYMLPLLLGIIGIIYYSRKDLKNSFIVLLLFAMTGLAIAFYLNMDTFQPRERDYAFAASFYAFAIWVGFGVFGIYSLFEKLKNNKIQIAGAILTTVACIGLVPVVMAKENWDDHDRSDRYTAMAIAKCYLDSCAPNAILFTLGDNDTFPLWYVQEVEGYRTDVRVCNLSLLSASWYADQMTRKAYESEPLPITFTHRQYRDGTRDAVYFEKGANQFVDVKSVVDYIASPQFDNNRFLMFQRNQMQTGSRTIPASFSLDVDKAQVIATETVKPEYDSLIVDKIRWNLSGREVLPRAYIIMLDILAHNNWERPVYYSSTLGPEGWFGLEEYFQLEGFAYRLVPIRTPRNRMMLEMGRVDSDILYEKLMSKYLDHNRIDKLNHPNAVAKEPAKYYYGGFNDPNVYHPEENVRIMTANIRQYYRQLAGQLVAEGKLDKAEAVLDLGNEVLPNEIFPYKRTYHYQYTFYVLNYINTYLSIGTSSADEKAKKMLGEIIQHYINEFTWLEASNDRTIAIQSDNIDNSVMMFYQIQMLFDDNFLHQCDALWQKIPMTKVGNVIIRDYRNSIDAKLRDLQDLQGIYDNLSRLNMFKKFASLTGNENIVKEANEIIDHAIGEINNVAPQAGEQLRSMINQ